MGGGNRLFCFIKDAKFFFLSPTIGAVYQYGDQILVSLLFPKTALVFINLAKQIIGASVMVSGTLCRVEQKNIFSSEKIERLTKIKNTYGICFLFDDYIYINNINWSFNSWHVN